MKTAKKTGRKWKRAGSLLSLCALLSMLLCLTGCGKFRLPTGSRQKVDRVVQQIQEGAGDLYEQADQALENVDTKSLKTEIRLALESLDAMGVSPTVVARNVFGIKVNPTSGLATGITGDLMEDAEQAVQKQSGGVLQDLFDAILGGISDFVTAIVNLIKDLLP